ncbi:MAG: S-layer homology domain-containing protein [Clostridia bacterium]|nr:S-layer homology domain-containing protein [Clostridia bacterium]
MKRKLTILLLILVMLLSTVSAATVGQINTADAMNDLGLFLGTDLGYELDNQLTRAQGVTMLVRMIGKEAEAKDTKYGDPFTDVLEWAKGYVGYAWKNKITNGISNTEFGPNMTMTDYMFLTLTLRALGYDDGAAKPDFVWNDPYALAKKVGLITSATPDLYFTRAEAIEIFWNALNAKLKGSSDTLADTLIEQGVFTEAEFKAAAEVRKNGRKENVGVPQLPSASEDDQKPGTSDKPADSEDKKPDALAYEAYMAMTPAEQQAYFESFANPADFFTWHNNAKAEYDASKDDIEIGAGGSIDLGDIVNGKG